MISIEESNEIASDILNSFRAHRANHHEFFEYLKESSKEGITPEQYLVYRDNFFHRTKNIMGFIAVYVKRIVDNHDYPSLAQTAKNFSDEGGHGIVEGIHLKLLEDGHNLHGRIVFGIPEITIPNAKNSPFLVPEALPFRKNQKIAFRSASYPSMTGRLLAHEDAADEMLNNFRMFIFEPYKGYYTEKDFNSLIEYYRVHRDDSKENGNVEEEHQKQALQIASNIIAFNPRAAKTILRGGERFLEDQSNLWDGMMREMQNSRFHGPKVLPKSEFLEVSNRIPSPIVKIKTNSTQKVIKDSNEKGKEVV